MDEMPTCSNNECDNLPVVRAFWPGQSPPPEYCIECACKMQNVAAAMGLEVHQELIDWTKEAKTDG